MTMVSIMCDILIRVLRNRAYVVGVTTRGTAWMRQNLKKEHDFSIDIGLVDDFKNDLENAGLEVEIK